VGNHLLRWEEESSARIHELDVMIDWGSIVGSPFLSAISHLAAVYRDRRASITIQCYMEVQKGMT